VQKSKSNPDPVPGSVVSNSASLLKVTELLNNIAGVGFDLMLGRRH
jgi:hypothetical protein